MKIRVEITHMDDSGNPLASYSVLESFTASPREQWAEDLLPHVLGGALSSMRLEVPCLFLARVIDSMPSDEKHVFARLAREYVAWYGASEYQEDFEDWLRDRGGIDYVVQRPTSVP